MATPHMESKAYAGITPKPSSSSVVHSKVQYSIITGAMPHAGFQPKWTMPLPDTARPIGNTRQEMYQLREVQT